jgi:hypothetical protein
MGEAPNKPDPSGPNSELPGKSLQAPLSGGRPVPIGILFSRLVLLAGVVGLAGLVAWVWNGKRHGPAGADLAIFSMLACGGSAGMALFVVGVTAGGKSAFAGLMSSILFRTLGPLALGLIWHETHRDWPIENLIEIHVPLFLVSLTVETILVIDIVSNSSRPGSVLGKGRSSRNMHG